MVSCVPSAINGLLEAAGSFSKLTNWSHHFIASIANITPPPSVGKLPIAVPNELSLLMKDMGIWENSVIPLISPVHPWEKLADIVSPNFRNFFFYCDRFGSEKILFSTPETCSNEKSKLILLS